MSFVSIEFVFAALVFFPLYWGLRGHRNWQAFLLILSGYLLYATWSPVSAIALLGFSMYIWLAGRWINGAGSAGRRRVLLASGVLIGMLWLLVSKYYEFVRQAAVDVLLNLDLHVLLPVIDVVAPVGISFFTFQAITYLVWQHEIEPQHTSLAKPLLYFAFWPTHFAGPIFRARDFFTQLESDAFGAPKHAELALYYILLGMVQKIVFANWLGSTFVDEAFKYPDTQTTISAAAAVLGYALQIFLDFSGYTLIVAGLGMLLGFTLPLNFRQPYLAADLRDFWRRWHISLSSFIRDYVYIPLGGNRLGYLRAQFNVLVAMLVSGLWHGASSTFLVWGAIHGAGMVGQNLYEKLIGISLPRLLTRMLTFAFVCLGWIFFRADSSEAALQMLAGFGRYSTDFGPQHAWLLAFIAVFFLFSANKYLLEQRAVQLIRLAHGWKLMAAATAMIFLVIWFGPSGVPDFIYYRF
ncbi:MAG TPA: MBOAT family O-acyltransferase [Gallionellaceae bacterium]